MHRRGFLILANRLFASVAAHAADLPADAITVTLTDTTVTRPGAVTGLVSARLGGGTEKLKRGELTVDGRDIRFVPAAGEDLLRSRTPAPTMERLRTRAPRLRSLRKATKN